MGTLRKPSLITLCLLAGCSTLQSGSIVEQNDNPPPQSGAMIRKAMAKAFKAEDKAELTRGAIALAGMGGSFSDATLDQISPMFDPLVPGGDPALLRERFLANRQEGTALGRAILDVPVDYKLVEGIAWTENPNSHLISLYVGTVVDGGLYKYSMAKDALATSSQAPIRPHLSQWQSIDLGLPRASVFGIAADQPRHILWITTGDVEQTSVEGERMAGLIAVNMVSDKVIRRIPIEATPVGAANDLVVAKDGTVYVSNSLTGAVHRCIPGCSALDQFVPAGRLKSAQGLALSHDGQLLYVADYSSGLWVVDIQSGDMKPIEVVQPVMLDGIDGLILSENNVLVGVQNGTNPRRIVRLQLDDRGRKLLSLQTLEQQLPQWGEPTLIANGPYGLTYIADGQWEVWGKAGVVIEGQKPRPTSIRSLPLPRKKHDS